MRIDSHQLSAVSFQPGLLALGMVLALCGLAAKCRAAGELPASCRIQCRTGQMAQTPDGLAELKNMGSGTLIDVRHDAGLILTCHHVITGAQEIIVEFPNGKRHGAVVVDFDAAADLAVLEIAKPSVAPIKLAASFTPGDELIVAGYGGEGIWQATRGRTQINDAGSQVNLTVATLVRGGDSGGPALNSQGELVGVVWGCRDVEPGRATYVTSGRPLHVMLTQYCQPCDPSAGGVCGPCQQQPSGGGLFNGRILNGGNGRLIQGADPIAIGPPAGQQPAAAAPAACDCEPELAAIGKRLDSVDSRLAGLDGQLGAFAKRDELAKYLRRDELGDHVPDVTDLVKRSELPPPPDLSNVATRDEVAQIAEQADQADKSLRERIEGVVGVAKDAAAAAAEGKVGLVQGIGWGKLLAAALGVSGPIGLGVVVAGGLVGRVLKKRLAGAGGRPAAGDFPDG